LARPRTSAKILEARGAFKDNPQRAREDLPGAGPFDHEPPDFLTELEKKAWSRIVSRLPKLTLSSSEELLVESAARVYARYLETPSRTDEFRRLGVAFMQHLKELGMTVNARAKLGTPSGNSKKNRFGALKND
jgi:phage terminase small subunit